MSDDNTFKILIPDDIDRQEVNAVVEIYRSLISEKTINNPLEAVKISESGVRGAINGVSGFAILLMVVPASWFTKKWIDEFIWPELRDKIDEPSKALAKWILSFIKIEKTEEESKINKNNS